MLKKSLPPLFVALAITFLALLPQLDLRRTRGPNYHGSYAFFDTDEVAYSAYVNALKDGRPRRNDPYTGRDDAPGAAQPESLFSIQFIPAYAVALSARLFRISTSTAFTGLAVITAFAASFSIYWLIFLITRDEIFSAVSTLFILCLSTLICAEGAARIFYSHYAAYVHLPFLRRYIPALVIPLFYLLAALIWRMISNENEKRTLHLALASGFVFTLLVFSYFYIWTAAAAWLACLALLLLIAQRNDFYRLIKSFSVIAACAVSALTPYFLLLSHRAATMDTVQALTLSHVPDFKRGPLIISFVVLLFLFLAVRRGYIQWRDKLTLFATSFALTPIVLFNQQVITGHSLQPIHYEQFITNYIALTSIVLALACLRRRRREASSSKLAYLRFVILGLAFFCWGVVEVKVTLDILGSYNYERDEGMLLARRLSELAPSASESHARPVVFLTELVVADSLPTDSHVAVLWARHMHVFSGVTLEENRERFYLYLYYLGVTEEHLRESLLARDFFYVLPLFGWERANPNLTVNWQPVSDEEIYEAADDYSRFLSGFTRETASRTMLSYVVTSAINESNLSNLDRWYERDAGDHVGDFKLYRVRLRP